MDTSDPDITFDRDGICNHCRHYERTAALFANRLRPENLEAIADRIKRAGAGKRYDCIVGLSGGADSSYLLHIACDLGLRPLTVHLDNGWDSELAINNIHSLVAARDLDLITRVVDWHEFRQLQLSYLRAGVVDIEVLTDHAITALVHRLAVKEHVRFILSGNNIATELIMPKTWNFRKADLRNIRDIARHHGGPDIKTLPTASTLRLAFIQYSRGIRSIDLLNYLPYDRNAAIETLREVYGWRDYGGKHYESFFTQFYQAYILPQKFGIDKRKAHLSTLINSGLMTRDHALSELQRPLYDDHRLADDKAYLVKKLGITETEFDDIMAAECRRHEDFKSDAAYALPTLHAIQVLLEAASRVRRRAPSKA